MARRAWGPVALLVVGAATGDCSLMGYDDFALAACTESSQCEPLNAARGIAADACMRYGCDVQAQRCVLRVRDADGDGDPPPACGGRDCDDGNAAVYAGPQPAREVCDGRDNDCDAVIDEGALGPRAAVDVVAGVAAVERVGFARGAAGRSGAAWQTATGQASLAPLQGATPATPLALGYATHASESPTAPALADGCRWRREAGEVVEQCGFGDVAVDGALNDTDWFVVGVNRNGCDRGQLRAGFAPVGMGARAQVVLRGPAGRSNVYLGVDLDATAGGCSGGSRTAGAPRGAARPAVATLARPGAAVPQALAAWLGDAVTRPECGGAPVAVEALGLWLESGTAGGAAIKWVGATNAAAPQVLGQTRGGARPAVAAWGERGYFVGYGAAEGPPALHFVPAFGDPPPPNPAAPGEARRTPPLAPGAAFRLPSGAAADAVSIAVGAIRAAGLELGVAWQQGCGAGSSVWFARVRYAPDGAGTFTADAPVQVSTGEAASAPSVAYVPSGFLVTGSTRGGMPVAQENDGGWVVAWVDAGATPRRVLAGRVSELDATRLDEPPIDLTHRPTADAPVGPTAPSLYGAATPGLLHYGYYDATRGAVVGADLLCLPAAR